MVNGIRPDKAQVTCGNCGYRFEATGNPSAAAHPHKHTTVDCPECPVEGVITSNEYGYYAYSMGDITVEEKA